MWSSTQRRTRLHVPQLENAEYRTHEEDLSIKPIKEPQAEILYGILIHRDHTTLWV